MRIAIDEKLLASLLVLGSVVEARDPYTGGHLWRVAHYAKLLGRAVGMQGKELFRLTLSAFLHDVGKIGIPDSILRKKGPLTDEEFAVMKTHPGIGRALMEQHPLGELVLDTVAHHHERVDGTGYPEALSYDAVSSYARIVAVVDVFDAVTSARPYRAPMSIDEGIAVLEAGRGTHFDPQLVPYFSALRGKDVLEHVVGHRWEHRPLLECASCGPIIVIPRSVKDGDTAACRSCGGEYRIHRAGGAFTAEATGETASANRLKPEADMDTVNEMLIGAPRSIRV